MKRKRDVLAALMAKHDMIELEYVEGINTTDEHLEAFEKLKSGEYVLKYNSYYKIIGDCDEKDIPLLISDQLEYISSVMKKVNACANIFIFGFICSVIAVIIWIINIINSTI